MYKKGSLGYFLELASKDGFDNLHDWNEWRKENGKLRLLQEIETERVQKMNFRNIKEYRKNLYERKGFENQKSYDDYLARNKGYEDKKDRNRDWHYERGSTPMTEDKHCSLYLGVHIAERNISRVILSHIFENIKEMPYGYSGYDFICDDIHKIDVKSGTIDDLNKIGFHIRWNKIATHFLLIGFKDREDLKILGIWLIGRDKKIRTHKNCPPGIELYKREGLKIKYETKYLEHFKKYDLTDRFIKNGIMIV